MKNLNLVKCLLLKSQKWLVSEIEEVEVEYELNMPNCKLINPYEIDDEENLIPWCKFSDDKEMMIFSDYIVTLVEPKPEILKKYLKIVE